MIQRGLNTLVGEYDFVGYRGISVHPYPATMPLPVAQSLLERYTDSRARILDPFAGSGTTLRAAASSGRPAIGIDMNPLACLIARVGMSPFDPSWSAESPSKAVARTCDLYSAQNRVAAPSDWIPWIERWFAPETISALESLSSAIKRVKVSDCDRDLLLTALSRTVRKSSLARSSELKLWRDPNAGLVDVLSLFQSEAFDLVEKLREIRNEWQEDSIVPTVICGDSSTALRSIGIFDAVLTSPPYGDSWTTVAYGNFTMLSRIWLGAVAPEFVVQDPTRADHRAPGGADRTRELVNVAAATNSSATLRSAIEDLKAANGKRAEDLVMFYGDLFPILRSVASRLKPGGRMILVMGPRHMAGTLVDSGLILSEISGAFGFTHELREFRTVSGKRLPSMTIQGSRGRAETINRETIDILEKQ